MKTKISKIAAITLFALIILVGNANAKETKLDASSHESTEVTLKLEDWMTNTNFWDTDDNLVIETISDVALQLEDWMVNKTIWEIENTTELKTETEQVLTFEPWMTNEIIWNR